MLSRRALPGTTLPHRNNHQTYALLHWLHSLFDGKANAKDSALVRAVFGPQSPAMGLDYGAVNGKSHAQPACFRGEERLENLI